MLSIPWPLLLFLYIEVPVLFIALKANTTECQGCYSQSKSTSSQLAW